MRIEMGGEFDVKDDKDEREITLGPVLLVATGCFVLALCGLSFWIGLSVGRHDSQVAVPPASPPGSSQPALPPAENSLSKPQAAGILPAAAPKGPALPEAVQPFGGAQSPADNALTSYAPSAASTPVSAQTAAQKQVKPALPPSATEPVPASQPSTSMVQTPAPPAAGVMVQIAALSRVDDARALVNALQQRGYAVNARREPADGLIHVRVGPFATRSQADAISHQLEGDGYNAEVQP